MAKMVVVKQILRITQMLTNRRNPWVTGERFGQRARHGNFVQAGRGTAASRNERHSVRILDTVTIGNL
jgi:hypothetical protein